MVLVLLMLAQSASPTEQVTPAPQSQAQPAPAEFEAGKATVADIMAKKGKPLYRVSQSDGTQIMAFARTHTAVKGASFIPVIGMFAGGAKTASSIDTYTFDRNGILTAATHTEMGIDCSGGLAGASCH